MLWVIPFPFFSFVEYYKPHIFSPSKIWTFPHMILVLNVIHKGMHLYNLLEIVTKRPINWLWKWNCLKEWLHLPQMTGIWEITSHKLSRLEPITQESYCLGWQAFYLTACSRASSFIMLTCPSLECLLYVLQKFTVVSVQHGYLLFLEDEGRQFHKFLSWYQIFCYFLVIYCMNCRRRPSEHTQWGKLN